jgi:PleD family two-component response regulator
MSPAGNSAPGALRPGRWRRERVLVVDDEKSLRRMLDRTLAAEGFEVTVATDEAAHWPPPSAPRPT